MPIIPSLLWTTENKESGRRDRLGDKDETETREEGEIRDEKRARGRGMGAQKRGGEGDKDEIETLRDEHSQARTQKAAVEVCRTSGIYSY